MNTEYIETFSEQIREVLNLTTPINLEAIVSDLQGEFFNFSKQEREEKACIEPIRKHNNKEDKPLFRIGICDSLSTDEQKKFSIAHELGHLFLHLKITIPEEWEKAVEKNKIFFWYGTSKKEIEANIFAESFLMPRHEFIMIVDQNTNKENIVDVIKVAKHFKVSKATAINRGRWLEILK